MYREGSVFDIYLVRRASGAGGSLKNEIVGGDDITDEVYEIKQKNFNPLKGITLDESECIHDSNNDGVCAPPNVIKALEKFIHIVKGKISSSPLKVLESAQEYLKCGDSELCVMRHPDFQQFVEDNKILTSEYLKEQEVKLYKPAGPADNVNWLDNVNIDTTLAIWARDPQFDDFYPYSMNMMDFEVASHHNSLAKKDIIDILEGRESVPQGPGYPSVKRPCQRMACVLNTDTSKGTGEHWVCLFIDCAKNNDPWTIEYFNSSGNFPPDPVIRFMHKTQKKLLHYQQKQGLQNGVEIVETVAIAPHQESNTECGLYCLFYIRKRLEGESYEFFQRHRVEDGWMAKKFRPMLFTKK
jgi:hypothetical protein